MYKIISHTIFLSFFLTALSAGDFPPCAINASTDAMAQFSAKMAENKKNGCNGSDKTEVLGHCIYVPQQSMAYDDFAKHCFNNGWKMANKSVIKLLNERRAVLPSGFPLKQGEFLFVADLYKGSDGYWTKGASYDYYTGLNAAGHFLYNYEQNGGRSKIYSNSCQVVNQTKSVGRSFCYYD